MEMAWKSSQTDPKWLERAKKGDWPEVFIIV